MPPPPQHHLAAVFEALAAAFGDRECIVWRDRRLTFTDVNLRTRQLARVLHGYDLGTMPTGPMGLAAHESPHSHVAIYAYNGNEYLEAMLGSFKARVAPINVNYKYVAEELTHVLANCAAEAIIFHSEFAPTLAEVLPGLPALRVLLQIADSSGNDLLPGAEWYEDALAAESSDPLPWADEWSPDDLYILYTGGTTGLPKGVLWRQADVHRTAMGGRHLVTRAPFATLDDLVEAVAANTATHRTVASSPYMHGAGHWTAFAAINQGATVIIPDDLSRLDPADLCRVIQRERVTYLQIVGDAFARPILDEMESGAYDLSSLRIVLSGGAALTPPMKSRFLALVPGLMLIESVGSSEGGGQAVSRTVAGETPAAGTFSPVEGSVVVAEDFSRMLDPGDDTIGWMAKRGHDLPIGYLGDPDKTARTFPEVLGERMVVPGDRARWLADGTIELLGRDAVTINSGGEKIFAEEVEAAIGAHPDVADVVVSSRPSERWGNEVVAIVQLRGSSTATQTDLATEAARHIDRYKLPKAWVFVSTVPRSPAGKADYRWAKEVAAQADGSVGK